MYTVVVCSTCQYCWIVQNRPERTNCGRCDKSHQFKNLRKFHTTEDLGEAKFARATVRAEVVGDTDGFESAKDAGALNVDIDQAVDDEEYLDAHGIDLDELDDVEERATSGAGETSRSRSKIVRDAISENDATTEAEVIAYAVEFDVTESAAEKTLQKLQHDGEVIETREGYRLV